MRRFAAAFLAATVIAAAPAAVSAQVTVAGFDSSSLPRCDDCFSTAQALGFSANFFGTTYTSTFVSNNGYLTFNQGQGSFTPQGLGAAYAGQPIIAAFFTDLDTRQAPSSPTSFGTGAFNGRAAFGVNYDNVGQFANNYTALNTIQILLVDRSDVTSGDFDIVFNYDDVNFGRNASAGYNAGQGGTPGTFFELPGSLMGEAFTDGGAFPLTQSSNVGVNGRFVFNVRNGIVTPPPVVPEPATWAMMIMGVGAIGATMRRRRIKTTVSFA